MKEHPLLFSGPMVRAILDGHKTETRRIGNKYRTWKKGDRIWVKETYRLFDSFNDCGHYENCDCYKDNGKPMYREDDPDPSPEKWKPSIFMKRCYSRITLEMIEDAKEEKLQDITEEGAIREGSQLSCVYLPKSCQQGTWTERQQFSKIWDSINGKENPWLSNPLVWVIKFRRIEE